MPTTLKISDTQLEREFAAFHDPESALRAIAEAKRPNSAEEFDEDRMIARYQKHVGAYVEMFGSAVDGLVELSRKDNPNLK